MPLPDGAGDVSVTMRAVAGVPGCATQPASVLVAPVAVSATGVGAAVAEMLAESEALPYHSGPRRFCEASGAFAKSSPMRRSGTLCVMRALHQSCPLIWNL